MLLNVLAGFVRAESGSVLYEAQEFLNQAPHKRNLGMVFQNYALFPHMNVAQNVAYPRKLRCTPAAEVQTRVKKAFGMVPLGHLSERGIDQLSGGQKQRTALAGRWCSSPRLL